jgi:hypothetical protein
MIKQIAQRAGVLLGAATAGALTGLLATAAAIGVAQLVAGITGPAGEPVIAGGLRWRDHRQRHRLHHQFRAHAEVLTRWIVRGRARRARPRTIGVVRGLAGTPATAGPG